MLNALLMSFSTTGFQSPLPFLSAFAYIVLQSLSHSGISLSLSLPYFLKRQLTHSACINDNNKFGDLTGFGGSGINSSSATTAAVAEHPTFHSFFFSSHLSFPIYFPVHPYPLTTALSYSHLICMRRKGVKVMLSLLLTFNLLLPNRADIKMYHKNPSNLFLRSFTSCLLWSLLYSSRAATVEVIAKEDEEVEKILQKCFALCLKQLCIQNAKYIP